MSVSHAQRQPLPLVVDDAARLIAALDKMFQLGRGEVVLDETDVPCARAVLTTFAIANNLDIEREYEESDGSLWLEVSHADRVHILVALKLDEALS